MTEYICPICKTSHRTEGWLSWHKRKVHGVQEGSFSRTRVRGQPSYSDDPDKYIKGRYGHLVKR